MKNFINLMVTLAALNSSSLTATAQNFAVDWFTLDGGGPSAGGGFSLNGAIGQSDANPHPMTGGAFSLAGGFWSLLVVQTPGAPLLSIERQGASVRIVWPLPATGFVLDQSLTVTGAWSQVSFPYATNVIGISISTPAPTGNKFFRLRKL